MAIVKLAQIERYIGTAAERAAQTTTGLPAGTTFFERDTGDMYKLDGAGVYGKVNTTVTGEITVTDVATETTLEAIKDTDGIKQIVDTVTTKEAPSDTLLAGDYTVTDTAAAIGASQAISEIVIQADPDNSEVIFVGNSTSQPVKLQPGASFDVPAGNIDLIFAKTTSGTATLNWIGRS